MKIIIARERTIGIGFIFNYSKISRQREDVKNELRSGRTLDRT